MSFDFLGILNNFLLLQHKFELMALGKDFVHNSFFGHGDWDSENRIYIPVRWFLWKNDFSNRVADRADSEDSSMAPFSSLLMRKYHTTDYCLEMFLKTFFCFNFSVLCQTSFNCFSIWEELFWIMVKGNRLWSLLWRFFSYFASSSLLCIGHQCRENMANGCVDMALVIMNNSRQGEWH